MEGIDKPHLGKYKKITNDSNYDASCTHTSRLRKFQALDFCCTKCTDELFMCFSEDILWKKCALYSVKHDTCKIGVQNMIVYISL
jgi:hypothetical protein